MDNQDHGKTHVSGHESHGVHLCHKCGWPFPNSHPSARHRRAHKRVCGTIEGYKLVDYGEANHDAASDDDHLSDEDHRTPIATVPKVEEGNANEKNIAGIRAVSNGSEDEGFSDAPAEFQDGGFSPEGFNGAKNASCPAIAIEKVSGKDLSPNPSCKDCANTDNIQSSVSSIGGSQMLNPDYRESLPTLSGRILDCQDYALSSKEPADMFIDDRNGLECNLQHIKLKTSTYVSEQVENITLTDGMTECSMLVGLETDAMANKEINLGTNLLDDVVSPIRHVVETSEQASKSEKSLNVPSNTVLTDGILQSEEDFSQGSKMSVSGHTGTETEKGNLRINMEGNLMDAVVSQSEHANIAHEEKKQVATSPIVLPEEIFQVKEVPQRMLAFDVSAGDFSPKAEPTKHISAFVDSTQIKVDPTQTTDFLNSNDDFDKKGYSVESVHVLSVPDDIPILDHAEMMLEDFKDHKRIHLFQSVPLAAGEIVKDRGNEIQDFISESRTLRESVDVSASDVNVLEDNSKHEDWNSKPMVKEEVVGEDVLQVNVGSGKIGCSDATEIEKDHKASSPEEQQLNDICDDIRQAAHSGIAAPVDSEVYQTASIVVTDDAAEREKAEDVLQVNVGSDKIKGFNGTEIEKDHKASSSEKQQLNDPCDDLRQAAESGTAAPVDSEVDQIASIVATNDATEHDKAEDVLQVNVGSDKIGGSDRSEIEKEHKASSPKEQQLNDSCDDLRQAAYSGTVAPLVSEVDRIASIVATDDAAEHEKAEVVLQVNGGSDKIGASDRTEIEKGQKASSPKEQQLNDTCDDLRQAAYSGTVAPVVSEVDHIAGIVATDDAAEHEKAADVLLVNVGSDKIGGSDRTEIEQDQKVSSPKEQQLNDTCDDLRQAAYSGTVAPLVSEVNQIASIVATDDAADYGKAETGVCNSAGSDNERKVDRECSIESTINSFDSAGNLSVSQVNPVSGVLGDDNAGDHGKGGTESFDTNEVESGEKQRGENVSSKTNSISELTYNHQENQVVVEDVNNDCLGKLQGTSSTHVDSKIPEDIKELEMNGTGKVRGECAAEVSGTNDGPDSQQTSEGRTKTELPSEGHTKKELSFPVAVEPTIQSLASIENNNTRESGGALSGVGSYSFQGEAGDSFVKHQLDATAVDVSVETSSQTDSLEGNWGSVSVLSTPSDIPTGVDTVALPSTDSQPSTEAGKANANKPKGASEGQHPDKADVFEPPSFMTLVEPGAGGQTAAASEVQAESNPEQLKASAMQAGWFPSLTHVSNESQGRRKNEEIMAKVTNWNVKKHAPLKNFLGEANVENKPNSPNPKYNPATVIQRDEKMVKDNGASPMKVSSIVGHEAPVGKAVMTEAAKEWNSPARYPADIKREKRKVKGRPCWVQFVCCSSVN